MSVCGALPLLFSHQVVWLCVERCLYCSHIIYCSYIKLYGCVWSVDFTVLTSSCMAVCGALTLLFSHQVVWLCVECRLYCSHIKLYGCVWSVDFTVLSSSGMAVCGALTLLFSHHFTVLTSRCMAVRGEIALLFSHHAVWLCVER